MDSKVAEPNQTTMGSDFPIPQETFAKAFRKHKEVRGWQHWYIANKLKISESAVEKWSDGTSCPNFASLCDLILLFGPGFANDILFPLGMAGVHMIKKGHLPIQTMLVKFSDVVTEMAIALQDNDVDPQEFARIVEKMSDTTTEAMAWLQHAKPRETIQ